MQTDGTAAQHTHARLFREGDTRALGYSKHLGRRETSLLWWGSELEPPPGTGRSCGVSGWAGLRRRGERTGTACETHWAVTLLQRGESMQYSTAQTVIKGRRQR